MKQYGSSGLSKLTRANVAAGLCLCLLGASAAYAQAVGPADVSRAGIEQRLDAQVPLDAVFVDDIGREVRLGDYFDGDKPVVLSLVYFTCPMLCGEVLNSMLEGLQQTPYDIGKDFTALTVSFDPRETPALAAEKKRNYVQVYGREGAADGWHFLTGEKEDIDRLCEAVGFGYEWDEATDQYAHAAGIMILTPDGRVSRYLLGIEYPGRDIRLALLDASERKIGSAVEQLFLLCYAYDPTTGTYTLLVHRLLQVAGVATVLVIGGVVGLLLWFERRQRRRAAGSETATDQGV